MITARMLEPEEWQKVRHIPPFDKGLPSPEHWRILCVFDGEEIVGCCSMYDTVHWDGFWIAPDHQGKSGVFRAMVAEGLSMLKENGVDLVHTTVSDGRPDLQAMVERFGYLPAPGKLYLLYVPDAKEL